MQKSSLAAFAIAGGLFLAGCGGEGETPVDAPAPAATSAPAEETTAAAPEVADSATAIEIAEQLEAEVATVVKVTEVTEDNDVNELIGRPSQYTSAAWIADEAMEDPSATGIDSGAVVEVFENAEDAKTRSDYIQGMLKESGGVLGTEYHHLQDNVLLRVSGQLKPSQAALYEEAFAG
ncbi:hypothetical protein [Arthrobacter sp. VKM Ac-2550]|uniref:hypothetical protein n=1 Tax=Crystallibacter permensis TaxID=1938888 RepID=UPI002225D3B9|nr:hypothetical protein [Arthrobacter sp. VKM Ac-2550]MCW2132368.1 hypothetical protein [Arthrobacter sp. VKM Ac-2550]